MKKSLLTLLGAGLLLTSCQSDEPFAPVEGGEKQVTFTLTAPTSMTRAGEQSSSNLGGLSNKATDDVLHYTLALYYGDNVEYKQSITSTDASVTFNPTVILGRNYRVVAYADFVGAKDDLKQIAITNGINNEKKDAYFANPENVVFTENDLAEQVTLTRPFGKLRLVATDYSDKTAIKDVSVKYRNGGHLNSFNAFKGEFPETTETTDATATYYDAVYDVEYDEASGEKTIFVDYIPVNGNGVFPFEITVTYTNGTESFKRTFAEDIPVKRNALTTLKGNFFTAEANISVVVNENFDDSKAENRTLVSTASQLQEVINNATPGETTEIILGNDIELTEPLVFGGNSGNSGNPAPTRSGAAKSFVLDLNGKTIKNPNGYVVENYSAELTISGNGRLGSDGLGGIRSHGGKLIIEGGNYTCSSNWSNGTYNHILKAENTEVVINGGTFDATVGGTNNAMINVSENSIVTINGGKFKNVNGVIPQFAPYMFTYEKNGKLIINDGEFYGGWRFNGETATTDIYGGNFTVSYDGQSFHANSTHVLKIYGGTFSLENGGKLNPTNHVAEGYRAVGENGSYNVGLIPAAKVGNTEYGSIDEAIASWTHNTTLTLLKDVTLTDVVTLKSTEHHILDLGKYTMTAASGKNAIEILPKGAGTAAKSCLTINADATTPGGINAGYKACIYYKKTDGSNDRMMVTINGGIFDGTISSSSNNGGQACPYFVFNGGVFNKSINLTKAMLKVTGGIFHGMFSCTGDSTAYRLISGGTFKSFTFMTADAANKFTIGTDKQVYNVGLYVDKDGYLVVGGPVITEAGDKFEAEPKSYSSWSSYLKYSSAATYGLYYEKQ